MHRCAGKTGRQSPPLVDSAEEQQLSETAQYALIMALTGAVALGAMAVGLVPVVMNYGGLGELVTPNTGFLLPMGTRPQIIDRLGALLAHLCENPHEIDAKSPAALHIRHRREKKKKKKKKKLNRRHPARRWIVERKNKFIMA